MASEYVVLRSEQIDLEPDDVWTAWREVGRATAATDVQAIKAVAKELGVDLDHAVAVPARSWRPRRREVRKVERESWS